MTKTLKNLPKSKSAAVKQYKAEVNAAEQAAKLNEKKRKEQKRKEQKAKKTAAAASKNAEKSTLSVMDPCTLLTIWFNGWKNCFTLSGRSSRFELWVFMVVNTVLSMIIQLNSSCVLSESFLRHAAAKEYSLTTIDTYIWVAEIAFWIAFLLPIIPFGALIIRRMHDLGRLAWHGYLEPLFMGLVVLSFINLTVDMIEQTKMFYTELFLETCFITIFYSVCFYGLKILCMTFFYRGDADTNAYGEALYKDELHEEAALNLSCIYFLINLTVALLYAVLALF